MDGNLLLSFSGRNFVVRHRFECGDVGDSVRVVGCLADVVVDVRRSRGFFLFTAIILAFS